MNKKEKLIANQLAVKVNECFEKCYETLKQKEVKTYMDRFTKLSCPQDIIDFIKDDEREEYVNKRIQKANKHYSEFDVWFSNKTLLAFNNIDIEKYYESLEKL